MSKLVKRDDFDDMVEIVRLDGESLGTFQVLDCDEHGNEWHYTDTSGSDNCFECIKEMCEPRVDYTIPGFENLEESLDALTIRKDTTRESE